MQIKRLGFALSLILVSSLSFQKSTSANFSLHISDNSEQAHPSSIASLTDDLVCVNVSSTGGWQQFDLGGESYYIASISGSWSVDDRRYRRVGAEGHNEPGLEPYNQYKYDQGYPFGALLVDIPNYGYIWADGPIDLPAPITSTSIRINDADVALGDNAGQLRVCFGVYPGL